MRLVYISIWYSRFVYTCITHVYISICQDIQWYTSICYLILVYTHIYWNIRVYTKYQSIWKIMHDCGIWTSNLCILSAGLPTALLASAHQYYFSFDRAYIHQIVCSPLSRHLAAGVGRQAQDPRCSPRRPWRRRPGPPLGSPVSGRAAACQWLALWHWHLSSLEATDWSQVEKHLQAAAGQLTCRSAVNLST